MHFTNWVQHFTANCGHLNHINYNDDTPLTAAERRVLTGTLQKFQRGENSEGKYLYHNARAYSQQQDDPSYAETIVLFIKEEQRHALALGRFMEKQGIARIRGHWIDTIFRKLRRLLSIEFNIIVLLTAEIIAAVAYIAIRNASRSKVLKAICNQILQDEYYHLNFQAYTLRHMARGRSYFRNALSRWALRILLAGTVGVVYLTDRKTWRAGAFNVVTFSMACLQQLDRVMALVRFGEQHFVKPQPALKQLV